jgi:hypothetical protein
MVLEGQHEGSVCWGCNNILVEENGEDLVYTFDGEHKRSQQLLHYPDVVIIFQ